MLLRSNLQLIILSFNLDFLFFFKNKKIGFFSFFFLKKKLIYLNLNTFFSIFLKFNFFFLKNKILFLDFKIPFFFIQKKINNFSYFNSLCFFFLKRNNKFLFLHFLFLKKNFFFFNLYTFKSTILFLNFIFCLLWIF